MPAHSTPRVVVVGAGPAGLTAAYLLAKAGWRPLVLEADPALVGGISRTARHRGYHFDIGGHRFFSKSREVEDLWTELLPDDMLVRQRRSRIFYRGRFFSYPLKALEAFASLGPLDSALCGLDYLRARLRPVKDPRSFEDWVTNQFGARLYRIFFQGYTEKVWGMSCRDLSADWAAQRIKGLSLKSAILGALRRPRGEVIKTLIESFRYPRLGPGMLWEAAAARVRALGGEVRLGRRVTGLRRAGDEWHVAHVGADGEESCVADHVIYSGPLRELILGVEPRPAPAALEAARGLGYRDFLVVALVVRDHGRIPDNWIYIQDPGFQVARIQNFKAWSPEMVPDPATTCYGLEYMCFETDSLWTSPDPEIIALARRELVGLGLAEDRDILDACVVRQPKAYPVYDQAYADRLAAIRAALEGLPGLHVVGRNGMHRYNNQDHSMMTAMLTVENIRAGRRRFDVWRVNEDAEYLEAGSAGEVSTLAAAASTS